MEFDSHCVRYTEFKQNNHLRTSRDVRGQTRTIHCTFVSKFLHLYQQKRQIMFNSNGAQSK